MTPCFQNLRILTSQQGRGEILGKQENGKEHYLGFMN